MDDIENFVNKPSYERWIQYDEKERNNMLQKFITEVIVPNSNLGIRSKLTSRYLTNSLKKYELCVLSYKYWGLNRNIYPYVIQYDTYSRLSLILTISMALRKILNK